MRWVGVTVALLMLSAPARADVRIIISKSSQQMAVSVDGAPPMYWTVSTGRDGYTTPSGNFRAIRLEEVYYSKKYDDAPMPNAVFFYGGYAIHGTLEESRLGRRVSHGCVRLARPNAATLFHLVRSHGMSNTRIVITDDPLRGVAAPMARYDGRGGYTYGSGPMVYERPEARSFSARGYQVIEDPAPRYARSYQHGRAVVTAPPSYHGFEQFAEPVVRTDRQRRVYWDEAPVRRGAREQLVPGRVYGEAEVRRIYRENGWRGY